LFHKAGVLVEELGACKSSRAKATKIGQFFGPLKGREVPIQVSGRTGRAILRVEEGRAKERRYYCEVVWDDAPEPRAKAAAPAGGGGGTDEGGGQEAGKKARSRCRAAGEGPAEEGHGEGREGKAQGPEQREAAGGRDQTRETRDHAGREQETGQGGQ